jgi:alkylation response protein AidB-like acyl-CoA dehydrogenase
MIDFTLTEEQLLLQKTARDFAEKEIKPAVKQVEALDGSDFDPSDICRNVFRKGTKLGFHSLLIPEKYGGMGGSCLDHAILLEELGAADVGIAAAYFNSTICSPMLLVLGGNEAQREKWLPRICSGDAHVFCAGLSESSTPGSEIFCPYPDPKLGIKTTAKRDGVEYVLNGSKSAFITNAGLADSGFITARTDTSKPAIESSSLFFLPMDTAGISSGKRTQILGWRTVRNAELFLDDVRVSVDNLIGGEGDAVQHFVRFLPYIGIGMASCYVGLARAAYECALDYAKQRVSWGQPIIRYPNIALMLAEMQIDTQAARLIVWDAALANDTNPELAATVKSPAAKTFAVDVAIRNAQKAVKIFGGYGVVREYPTARFLCDAWTGWPADATNDMLRLNMANFL